MKVELIDHMGSDLSVVNAARVSFDKQSKWLLMVGDQAVDGPHYEKKVLSEADTKLIQFLARGMTTSDFNQFLTDLEDNVLEWNGATVYDMLWQWRRNPTHYTPFAHPHVTFRLKAPIFVARQLEKHQVGFTWSEVSRRYVDSEPEFFVPEVWRKRAENVKQGSSDETIEGWEDAYRYHLQDARELYQGMVDHGVCPEQARMVLPQSMMTEWIWTGSLYGWANLFNQRKQGSHAQRECWPYATAIGEHMLRLFPVSWKALTQ